MATAEDVPAAASRQAGVFTAAQAVAAGWSARQVERRRSSGRWRRVCGKGLTARPQPDDAWRRAWAAALTWPEAVIAGPTAAVLHGFPVEIGIDVDVYSLAGRRPLVGLRPMRIRLEEDEVELVGDVPVTSRQRTAVDCLAALPWSQALDLYAWLSTRKILTHTQLAAYTRHRFAKAGTAQLVRLLRATQGGAVSGAESLFHALMRRASVTGWRAGATLWDDQGEIGVVDVVFDSARLVVEIDGEKAHRGRKAFLRDRRKQNRLVNAGYRVLRFTYWDLIERPEAVIAEVLACLQLAA